MTERNHRLHNAQKGSALAIRVFPRAKRDQISEILADGTIKIRLAAPPVDGKANQALINFLAGVLEIPSSRIEIIAGANRRNKLVSILGLDAEAVNQRILTHLSQA